MKKNIYIFILAIISFSCTEEVIIEELDNLADPRLVIDANINVHKNLRNSRIQTIKLTTTSSYYNNIYPAVTGANIQLTDEDDNILGTFLDVNPDADDITEDGVYTCNDFSAPETGKICKLSITINGETYTAEDTYTSVVNINYILQDEFSFGEDGFILKANINNEIDVDNYFYTKIKAPFRELPEYGAFNDDSYREEDGDSSFEFNYADTDLQVGMEVDITLYGITSSYYNYLTKLLALSQGGNGPFSTAPATVRGNIINITDLDNYALGYFAVNQYVEEVYTIKEPVVEEEEVVEQENEEVEK